MAPTASIRISDAPRTAPVDGRVAVAAAVARTVSDMHYQASKVIVH